MSDDREFDEVLRAVDGPMPLPPALDERLRRELSTSIAERVDALDVEPSPSGVVRDLRRRWRVAVIAAAAAALVVIALLVSDRDEGEGLITVDPTPAVTAEPAPTAEPTARPTPAPIATPTVAATATPAPVQVDAEFVLEISISEGRSDLSGPDNLARGSTVRTIVRNVGNPDDLVGFNLQAIVGEATVDQFVAEVEAMQAVVDSGRAAPPLPDYARVVMDTPPSEPTAEFTSVFQLNFPGPQVFVCRDFDLSWFRTAEPFTVE